MLKERRSLSRRLADAVAYTLDALEQRILHAGHNEVDADDFFPVVRDPVVIRRRYNLAHGLTVLGSPLSSIPALNSNPGAGATLYLDFNGDGAQTWGSYNVPVTAAYDSDGDTSSFSATELANIQQIWSRVAEAYSPFNINVTTVDPGALVNGQSAKVVIGGAGAWLGASAGGVAYLNAFTSSSPNVGWAFTANLGNGAPKYTADCIAHEAGHMFGLQHQSAYSGATKTAEYRQGNALAAPIMGVSYYAARGLWSNGQSSLGYNRYQDDLAVLANGTNGFGYRADDHGNSIGSADALMLSGAAVSASGIIGSTSDVDVFSFYTEAGVVNLSVSVAQYGAMLDATLQLVDLDGNIIAASNTASLSETISTTLPAGSYRLVVSSKGSYGDVGQYTISGTIVPNANYIAAPSNLSASSAAGGVSLTWYDNAWNETGYVIERSDDGGATWNPITTTEADVRGYVDATAVVGSTYSYRVYAQNDTDTSGNSNTATVAVTPATPGSLSATSVSSSRIDLSWGDVTGDTGYVIERSLNGTTWTTLTTIAADSSSYSDTSVAAGTRYFYRIRATGSAGNSALTSSVNATTRTATPTLTLTVYSSSRINLTWSNVLGETGYRIERSLDGSTWSTLATTAANVAYYYNLGLSANTAYSYRVVALNAGGDSGAGSNSGTTLMNAPTGLAVTANSTSSIALNWVDSSGETGYRIERSLDQRTWVTVTTAAADATSWTDSNLAGGTAYAYRLRALNAGGASLPSIMATTFTIPLAPTLAVVALSHSQLKLTWSNVAGETSYLVERSDDGVNGWTTVYTASANVIAWNNIALSTDTSYFYRVTARNASGDSAPSAAVSGHTLLAPVSNVSATSDSTSAIHLNWDDASGESAYRIERSLNGLTWLTLATPAADTTSYDDSNLSAGTTYYYRVRATNAGGNSLVTANAYTTTIPGATTLAASTLSTTQIKLTWSNVSGETGYHIERSLDGSTWALVSNVAANTILYVDSGLSADTQYSYRVTPYNASGDAAVSVVATRRTLLNAPVGLTATAASTSTMNLAWTDSSNETGYVIERSLNGVTWYTIASVAADVTSHSNTGLSAGTSYSYRVRAGNAGGNSAASGSATAVTIPAAVNVVASAASPTQINLAWTNVSGETGYRVERSLDGSTWSTIVTRGANVISYYNTGLSADTLYWFRVTPFNAAGDAASTTVQKRTLLTAPTNLAATAGSATSITLTWDNSTGETGYKLERFNGRTWSLLARLTANTTTYTNTGLLPGRVYYYRLRASNASGDSPVSATAQATTPASATVVRRSPFQSRREIPDPEAA